MKYIVALALVITLGYLPARAQSGPAVTPSNPASTQSAEDSVKTAINALFVGMKNADTNQVRNAFSDSAILQSIITDPMGNSPVRTTAISQFLIRLSSLGKDAADERVHIDWVKVDGPLATVWAPYSFFLNGKFHHCGVDTFQMLRTSMGWKIQYIIYTGRMNGCPLGTPDAP